MSLNDNFMMTTQSGLDFVPGLRLVLKSTPQVFPALCRLGA
jgi:hypothetical protein